MESEENRLQKIDKLSFEEALQKLEELVTEMESGNSPLEKMIRSFEEGSILASACQAKLDVLRKKIEILRKDRQSGNYKWTPLQSSAANPPESSVGENEKADAPDTEEDVPF